MIEHVKLDAQNKLLNFMQKMQQISVSHNVYNNMILLLMILKIDVLKYAQLIKICMHNLKIENVLTHVFNHLFNWLIFQRDIVFLSVQRYPHFMVLMIQEDVLSIVRKTVIQIIKLEDV